MTNEKKKASEIYKKLASGGTAELYDMGDGRLFKDFHEDKPDFSIENEYDCTTRS